MYGSGSIRERRPGVWELSVFVGRDTLTGKRRTKTKVFRGTRAEASKALAALRVESADERPSAVSGTTTVGELLDRWLEFATPELSPTTSREYRRLIDKRIKPPLGSVPLRRLETATLDRFYRALSTQAGLSASSVHQVHSVIRRALAQAIKWSWISSNPAANASPPRVRRQEIKPPTLDQVRQLLAAADQRDAVLAVALRLAAATGMRRGEVCGLRWTNVDFEQQVLSVEGAVATTAGGVVAKGTKTHQTRRVALDDATVQLIRAHRSNCEAIAERVGVALAIDAFLVSYSSDGSTPVHPDSLTGAFRRLAKSLKLEGVRLHDLRHAHATELLAAGVPVKSVSQRLGHADASMTLNVYAHALESTDRAAADLIGGMFGQSSASA